jgi:hypothetical protein
MPSQYYQRKCPYHVPQDQIKFDNRPTLPEQYIIHVVHFISRILVQAGAFESKNPIIYMLSFILYVIDGSWSAFDPQYFCKRQAMFGQNFISVMSLVISKYDANAVDSDSFDARMISIPQRRGFFLGNTVMNSHHLPWSHDGSFLLSPLHVSDPGNVTMHPSLPANQPNHDELRNLLMTYIFKDEPNILKRLSDVNSSKILLEFATQYKKEVEDKQGKKRFDLEDVLSPLLEKLLVQYLFYSIYDVPIDIIPRKLLHRTYYDDLKYVFYHYGPRWLSKLSSCYNNPRIMRGNLDKVKEFILQESATIQAMPHIVDERSGLKKDDLVEMMHIVMGIAALQGIKALASNVLSRMPKGYTAMIAKDDEKLRSAVLECARLDTPVTGSHCIIDNDEGLTTQIGGKSLSFKKGTIVFNGMTIANIDHERFPSPFVFDPANRDFSKLTSFHSVGESTNITSPRICPGRNMAITAVMQIVKATVAIEDISPASMGQRSRPDCEIECGSSSTEVEVTISSSNSSSLDGIKTEIAIKNA